MSRAIFAASLNPFHRGHLDIIDKASRIFDELYVVVAHNADKPNTHTSIEAIKDDLKAYTVCNTKVLELPPNKLLTDFAEQLGVEFLVRGIRSVKDFMSELEMADINYCLSKSQCETVLLISDPMYRHISSSLIRSLVGLNGWKNKVEAFMPQYSAEEFIKRNS